MNDSLTGALFDQAEKVTKKDDHTASLVVMNGEYKGLIIELDQETMSCGRAPENEIYFPYDQLSRRHFQIKRNGKSHYIRDSNSTNGTFINNNKIDEESVLAAGDLVRIGAVCMKYTPVRVSEQPAQTQPRQPEISDKLTGCYNKDYFSSKLEKMVKEHASNQLPLCLLALEIDNIGSVRKDLGHDAVDFMLTNVATFIREKCIRGNDQLGRYGDETFVLLLSGISAAKAKDIAERLKVLVEKKSFKYKNHLLGSTLSIGLSGYNKEINNGDELLTQAGYALEQSKKNGPNIITVYGASSFLSSEDDTALI